MTRRALQGAAKQAFSHAHAARRGKWQCLPCSYYALLQCSRGFAKPLSKSKVNRHCAGGAITHSDWFNRSIDDVVKTGAGTASKLVTVP